MMFRKDSSASVTSDDGDKSVESKKGKLRGFEQMTPLPDDFAPSDDDVLLGRGKKCKEATGNMRFKSIVSTKLNAYLAANTRADKTSLIEEVIAQVRRNSPHGGFVKQHKDTEKWYEVGDFLAKEKTAQAFRDALHEYYASSNPAKKKRNLKRKQSLNEKNPVVNKVGKSASAPQMHTLLKSATPASHSDSELNSEFLVGAPHENEVNMAAPQPNFSYNNSALGQMDGQLLSTPIGGGSAALREMLEPIPLAGARREGGYASLALSGPNSTSPLGFSDQWLAGMNLNPVPYVNPNFYPNTQERPLPQMHSSSVLGGNSIPSLPPMLTSALGYPDVTQTDTMTVNPDPEASSSSPPAAPAAAETQQEEDVFEPIPLSKYEETMFSKFT